MNKITGALFTSLFAIAISSFCQVEAREPEREETAHFDRYGQSPTYREDQGYYPPPPYPGTSKHSAPVINVAPQDREDLTINFSNKSDVEQKYIEAFYKRGEKDGEVLRSTLDRLRGNIEELNQLSSDLHTMSDSRSFQAVPVKEFLDRVEAYRKRSDNFKIDIQTLKYLPKLRPDITADKEGVVNMQELVDYYNGIVQAITRRAELLHFTVKLPDETTRRLTIVEVDEFLDEGPIYSPEEIERMSKEITALRIMPSRDRRVIDTSINHFTFRAIHAFIDTFGTSQRYRTSVDLAGAKRAKEMLLDAFWARSYLRAVYGIKIGSIPVEYTKRVFNLDYYLSDMQVPSAQAIYDVNDLTRYANMATEAFGTVESSASREWRSVNAWVTWASGKSNEMDTKFFIIGLLKRDLDEEITLSQAGGLKRVRDGYKQHYLTDKAARAFFESKANQTFGFGDDDDDIESDVGMVDADTLKGSLAQSVGILRNQENRLERARKLQKEVDMMTQNSLLIKKRKQRELFN